jgi:pyridoxal phosphate enzyme (YggS family)
MPDMISAPETTDAAPQKLVEIHQRMAAALKAGGRAPDAAHLLAISKTKPAAAITPLIAAGHRHFGENRVQEAANKWPALKAAHQGLELHLVGPLQTNKAKQAIELFDVIQTLDREKLARKMAALKQEKAEGAKADPQKSGLSPSELAAFHVFCTQELGLDVVGLMCLPPQDEAAGPHFALLAKMAADLGLSQLSMGMSGDFETALSLGATQIRIGTALFGARD